MARSRKTPSPSFELEALGVPQKPQPAAPHPNAPQAGDGSLPGFAMADEEDDLPVLSSSSADPVPRAEPDVPNPNTPPTGPDEDPTSPPDDPADPFPDGNPMPIPGSERSDAPRPADVPDENGDDEDEPDEPLDGDEPADPPNTASSPSRMIRYESRIAIVEAWQYPGPPKNLAGAPSWVDRNWLAWGDYDPLRALEAGPALRVPTSAGDTVVVRPGDYIARQEVKIFADQPGDIRLEAWQKEQFERLFIPTRLPKNVKSSPPQILDLAAASHAA